MTKIKLSEICDLQNGYAFKSTDYVEESNTLSCRMSNIRLGGIFDIEYNSRYLPDSFAEKFKSFLLQDGDLVIAMTDLANDPKLLGVPTLVQTNGKNILLNQRVGKLVIKNSSKVDNKYLQYVLNDPKTRKYYKKFASGGLQINLGKSDLLNVEIFLPPIDEQRRIASILDKADELRKKRQQSIKKLDQLLQTTFVDMFGDPVSNPKKWKVKQLKDLSIKIHSGNTPKGGSENYVDEGIIFLRSQNVWKNKIILDDVAYIDEETHAKMLKSSVKYEDILMTKTGRINTENSSLGRASIYLGKDDSANINGHVYLIRIKEDFNKYFILSILTLPDYYEYIRSVCVGGIDKRQLNKEHLENFPIIQPPLELQNKFSNIVKVIESQKPKLLEQLKLQEKLFNTLQNKAFSGNL